MPFSALLALVESAVARGTVERWADPGGSGLQVLNYRAGAPEGPAESMCRGLVLHPASSTVVATPFVRFKTSSGDQEHSAASGEAPARACFKVDGSLVIAFMWQGQVHVATKRRMDSEQAQWAAAWLRSHCPHAVDRGLLQPGWTLMFEAVYQRNRVVVGYPFEGLVLLGAVKPCGREEGEEGLLRLAQGLGVPLAPTVHGTHQELVARLGRGSVAAMEAAQRDMRTEGSSSSQPGLEAPSQPLCSRLASDPWPMPEDAPPSYEGWVLASPDGQRTKLVQYAYAWTCRQALTLHPLVVWDRVCTGGLSPRQLAAGLPPHMRAELGSILVALESWYWEALDELERCYRVALEQEGRQKGKHAGKGGVRGRGSSTRAGAGGTELVGGSTGGAGVGLHTSGPSGRGQSSTDSLAHAGAGSCSHGQHAGTADSHAARREALEAPAAGFVPGALDIALAYALDHQPLYPTTKYALPWSQSQRPGMFYHASQQRYASRDMPLIRVKLLRMVQPKECGELPGYRPSPAFQQTWAKEWVQGPKVGRLAPCNAPPGSYFPIQDLPVPLFAAVIKTLDGEALGRAPVVCKEWARLMQEDRTVMEAVRQAKEAKEQARKAAASLAAQLRSLRYLESTYWGYASEGGYSSDDWRYGYGSP